MLNPIASAAFEAGIIGAGGAGFPTHIKLSSTLESEKFKDLFVIANGAECEPLLYTDQFLMQQYPEALIQGLLAAMEAVAEEGHLSVATQGIIAVKEKYNKVVEVLGQQLIAYENIHLHLLPDIYPIGDEQVLVYETLGRVVPEGQIPPKVGVLVHNVGTLINLSKALKGSSPVTEKYLTVAGVGLSKPQVLCAPIGTSVRAALNHAGVSNPDDFAVLSGGVLMCCLVSDLEQPITKTTSGLILLEHDHPVVIEKKRSLETEKRLSKTVCCQCYDCSMVCPRTLLGSRLQPHLIMRQLNYLDQSAVSAISQETLNFAHYCCECGLCAYYITCPMGLSPRKVCQALKKQIPKPEALSSKAPLMKISPYRNYRQIPTERIKARLGLLPWDGEFCYIDKAVQPKSVRLPAVAPQAMVQHFGKPEMKILVKVGQKVRAKELIADLPEDALGSKVHASISGVVTSIGNEIIIEN